MTGDHTKELEEILDRVSYEITSARASGLDKIEELRTAIKSAHGLLADADALAGSVASERSEEL